MGILVVRIDLVLLAMTSKIRIVSSLLGVLRLVLLIMLLLLLLFVLVNFILFVFNVGISVRLAIDVLSICLCLAHRLD
jgi:hypothetical protein